MTNYNQIIVLERTTNFSSRAIHFGMWLYQILRFKKPRMAYNHGYVGNKYGRCIEAVSRGVVNRVRKPESIHKTYEFYGNLEYAREQAGKKYEYTNFIFHALRINVLFQIGMNLFITLFPKLVKDKGEKKFYCIELCTRTLIANGYDVDVYLNPYEFECWCDKNLKLIEEINK